MRTRAGEAVRHAQAELERAVRDGNLSRDPMRYPLGALAVTLGAQHQLHVSSVRQLRAAITDLERQVSSAVEIARQPVDPAAIVRLEQAAVTGADRRAAVLARAHNGRTVLIAAAILVGAVLVAGSAGYWAGRRSQLVTEAALSQAAFRDGADAAKGWLNLMRVNDWHAVWAACASSTVVA